NTTLLGNVQYLTVIGAVCQLLANVGLQAATIHVSSAADSGPGTLRQALAIAQDGDTIKCSATGTTSFAGGELLVAKSVSILGPGPDLLVLIGMGTRVFTVCPGLTVSISGLSISGGYAFSDLGGGIRSDHAALTLINCAIIGNYADWDGGGIFSDGR